jgi:SAM-dependent methyltransferase
MSGSSTTGDRAPAGIDTTRPHPARMYDYFLGGYDNYEVDRAAAERVVEAIPEVRFGARANRAFMRRAVRVAVGAGIRQIVDIGTGIPTSPNTHEVARSVSPDVRVAYVDNDPIVAAHAGARLTNTPGTAFFLGDVRDPKSILEHPALRELIDFDQPVALLLVAVLHFVRDDEDPAAIVAELTAALAPGSYLVLSHVLREQEVDERADDAKRAYAKATATLSMRSHDEILAFFDGFDLVEPGLVRVPFWRPEEDAEDAEELARISVCGGVAALR